MNQKREGRACSRPSLCVWGCLALEVGAGDREQGDERGSERDETQFHPNLPSNLELKSWAQRRPHCGVAAAPLGENEIGTESRGGSRRSAGPRSGEVLLPRGGCEAHDVSVYV